MKDKIDNVIKAVEGVKVGTWVRLALLVVSFINLGLALAGKGEISVDSENLYTIFSFAFSVLIGALNYWKNNSFTIAAQKADEYFHSQGIAEEESLL